MLASLISVHDLLAYPLVGQVTVDKMFFHINEHLATTPVMVGETGAVVSKADYVPFGKPDIDTGSSVDNQFRFAGQDYNAETVMNCICHRYYILEIDQQHMPDPTG